MPLRNGRVVGGRVGDEVIVVGGDGAAHADGTDDPIADTSGTPPRPKTNR